MTAEFILSAWHNDCGLKKSPLDEGLVYSSSLQVLETLLNPLFKLNL